MVSIVYVSSAASLFSEEELVALLQQSREKNTRLNVSGLLLYKDGNFMQVLEGEGDAVYQLSNTIALDPRHRGFIKLIDAPIVERQFADWSMGFQNLSGIEAAKIPGYSAFLDEPLDSPAFVNEPGRAWKLLRIFRKNT